MGRGISVCCIDFPSLTTSRAYIPPHLTLSYTIDRLWPKGFSADRTCRQRLGMCLGTRACLLMFLPFP